MLLGIKNNSSTDTNANNTNKALCKVVFKTTEHIVVLCHFLGTECMVLNV